MAITHTGDGIQIYRARIIASGLVLYKTTGMLANRAYTPKNMMRAAAEITGKKYKARDYLGAATDLKAWADERTPAAVANGEIRHGR